MKALGGPRHAIAQVQPYRTAKGAPRTEEGYRPWRAGELYFVVYEVEGSIRVGEHRLRHHSAGTACRGREGAAAERSSDETSQQTLYGAARSDTSL